MKRIYSFEINKYGIIAILNKKEYSSFLQWLAKRPSTLDYLLISETRELDIRYENKKKI